jgi:hypothetical protein
LKCDIGREEELLQKMPDLPKEIAGEKQKTRNSGDGPED